MRWHRLAAVVLVVALAAGCVRSGEPDLVPAADEDAPGAPPSAATPSPSGNASSPGAARPSTPTAPTTSTGGSSGAPLPPPAGWSAGPGSLLRAQLDAAIARGEAFTLPVMPVDEFAGSDLGFLDAVDRALVLRPSPILAADAWAEKDGARIGFPAVAVYEGHLDGDEDALARLTVTPQWARGSVRIGDDEHVIRVNMDGNVPRAPGAAASFASFPLAIDPRPAMEAASYQEADCNKFVPPGAAPQLDLGRSGATPLVTRTVLDSDASFAASLGPDALPMMIAMMAEVDSIYDHELAIRFQIVGVHLTTDEAAFPKASEVATVPGTGEYNPLPALASRWNARGDVDRDMVHLFVGEDSGFAQANCIGAAGSPEDAYSFSPFAWERAYPTFHVRASAHEIGHLFAAHHHYANHAEGPLATLMLQGYTPGAKPVFGTLEKSVIRGWAESRLS